MSKLDKEIEQARAKVEKAEERLRRAWEWHDSTSCPGAEERMGCASCYGSVQTAKEELDELLEERRNEQY